MRQIHVDILKIVDGDATKSNGREGHKSKHISRGERALAKRLILAKTYRY